MNLENLKANRAGSAGKNLNKAYHCLTIAALSFTGSPAFAQLERITSQANTISTFLTGLAIVVVTIAFLYVGFKVLFRGQALADLWHVLVGGLIVGGAAGFASFAMGT